MIGEVYLITNLINLKKYVGITSRGYLKRFEEHIRGSNTPSSDTYNTPFKRALRKYGRENFKIELLKSCDTMEQAKEYEIFYIKEFNTFVKFDNCNGYNCTMGGDGVSGLYGKPIVQIDKYGNIIQEFQGITEAEQVMNTRGICECCQGIIRTSVGFLWYYKDEVSYLSKQELIDEISIRLGKVVQFDLEGNTIKIWNSITEASKSLNCSAGNISMVCNNIRNHCKNYVWKFYNDYMDIRDNMKEFSIKPRKTTARKVRQLDLKRNLIKEWNSITDAEDKLNINGSKIIAVCRGERNTTGGYKWEYL